MSQNTNTSASSGQIRGPKSYLHCNHCGEFYNNAIVFALLQCHHVLCQKCCFKGNTPNTIKCPLCPSNDMHFKRIDQNLDQKSFALLNASGYKSTIYECIKAEQFEFMQLQSLKNQHLKEMEQIVKGKNKIIEYKQIILEKQARLKETLNRVGELRKTQNELRQQRAHLQHIQQLHHQKQQMRHQSQFLNPSQLQRNSSVQFAPKLQNPQQPQQPQQTVQTQQHSAHIANSAPCKTNFHPTFSRFSNVSSASKNQNNKTNNSEWMVHSKIDKFGRVLQIQKADEKFVKMEPNVVTILKRGNNNVSTSSSNSSNSPMDTSSSHQFSTPMSISTSSNHLSMTKNSTQSTMSISSTPVVQRSTNLFEDTPVTSPDLFSSGSLTPPNSTRGFMSHGPSQSSNQTMNYRPVSLSNIYDLRSQPQISQRSVTPFNIRHASLNDLSTPRTPLNF